MIHNQINSLGIIKRTLFKHCQWQLNHIVMIQFVPYTNEEQSVIRHKKRSDWRQTVITMYSNTNKERNEQQAVQVEVSHQGQDGKENDVENDEPT